jgi:hypothetical protein
LSNLKTRTFTSMRSLGIFRDTRERAIGGEVGTWLMDGAVEEVRGFEGRKAVVDVALESVFNKLKTQHKEAVDKERNRRQEESDEKERVRVAEEMAKEEKRLAEERARIKELQDNLRLRIVELMSSSKTPVAFANVDFVDIDGGSNPALGTLGGTSGEIMLSVYSWASFLHSRDDKVTDDQLTEMVENVIKAMTVEKIAVNHLALTGQADPLSGNVQDDYTNNEALRDDIVNDVVNAIGGAGLTMDCLHRMEEGELDIDVLNHIKKELVRFACTT